MQPFNMLVVTLCLVAFFSFIPSVRAQKWYRSDAAPATQWNISLMTPIKMDGGSSVRMILSDTSSDIRVSLGFYSMDDISLLLSIFLTYYNGHNDLLIGQPQVIWSANRHYLISSDAILSFTREGELLLHDGDGTLVWSTATNGRSVVSMRLKVSGNLVLLNQNDTTTWPSFDHPTDSLVLGQSLCRGVNLTANISVIDWALGQVYFSTLWNGLQLYYGSTPYTKVFQPTVTGNATSTCYTFVNGSLGSPNQIFSLPLARSMQFIRLESDGHLSLYDMKEAAFQMALDVLSNAVTLCNYPRACGDYGVCSNGQCSCPSLSYFWPLDERHPSSGCMPLTALSCNHMQEHQFLALDHISYFSDISFQLSSTPSATKEACKQSCIRNCLCKIALFQNLDNRTYGDGRCLLLADEQLVMLTESYNNRTSAFVKIQGNLSTKRRMRRIRIIVGCSVGSFALTSIIVSIIMWRACKKVEDEEYFVGITGIPKRFSLHDLKVATSNFSVRLGGGGFGSVFEGSIGKERIAVKRLEGVGQGKEEFLAEVETIGRIHHINLARLIGFCAEKSHRLLVYEYMCNGSLDAWIFNRSPVFTLSWNTRRNIIMDITKGLSYLHEECKQRIAHLDIKPQNILLDAKFNAKLSDFGLSKMINRDQSKVMTRLRGTRGYLAPEWLGSKITEKADIYSFGIVIMEILCGRKNLDETRPEESIHLISLLQEKARSGQLFDLVDNGNMDMQTHRDEVLEMIKLAMWCLQIDASRRPLMSTVAKVLEGAMSMEAMPDCNFVPSFASTQADVLGQILPFCLLHRIYQGPGDSLIASFPTHL